MSGWRRVWFVMWKELLELRQDPRIFLVVLVAPVLQLTLLGYAATTDIVNVPIVIADGDRSPASRDLVGALDASRHFDITDLVTTGADAAPYLETGRAWLAIVIPPGLGERLHRGEPTIVQILADGSDANSSGVALSYATGLISQYAAERAAASGGDRTPARAVRVAGLEAAIRVWYNPELESRDFMIPGVLALVLLVMTTVLASMAIVREKENGTLEQLNVTPVARWELIAGKLLPYALIGLVDVFIAIAVTVGWFAVPLRGSVLLLIGLSMVFLLTTLGIGLFVSTVAATQQQAMMTSTFFFLIPMLYLSGFIFPIENMPAAIQPFTYLVPLRYYLVIVRGIFLKGIGLEILWPQALALLAWGLGILGLAVVRSTKRLK